MVQKQAKTRKKNASGGGGGGGGSRTAPTSASPKEPFATSTSTNGGTSDATQLGLPEQQRLLNHFTAAFDAVLTGEAFPQLLQEIKQALFQRDFARAFGREDYLEAYAARWSPTRALCYAGIFRGYLPPHLGGSSGGDVSEEAQHQQQGAGVSPQQRRRTKMVCIGGCAAEHVAFASYLQSLESSSPDPSTSSGGKLTLLDSAPWAGVSAKMQSTLTSPLPLSKYASAAAKATNVPLVSAPEQLDLRILQQDALDVTESQWADILTPLYTNGGIAKTTKFLKSLEAALPDGALLLVVDSPGSYSVAALGKEQKKYPMQWLLHHTLTDQVVGTAHEWTRLETHDSLWFRLSDQLSYPIQLENMRYQLHLYRKDKTP
ncbi:hypothetical protein NLG97_g7000 [Lecanicillium saksenae]|uniref:Uncharacterized protein n=1 Tax=Lecanicillium saksenae TaxID=468837 RepID=A0ACC1QQE3_9HYPO|nr:hypothetical protein NLG97_g7000 [Lecanicillium saksenae]